MKMFTLLVLVAGLMTVAIDSEAAPRNAQSVPSATTIEADAPEMNESSRRHNISAEILGRGFLYSFNYDYMLTNDVALGAGLSRYSVSSGDSSASAWVIPLYANYYFNEGKHRFFGTGGANLLLASGTIGDDSKVSGSGLAGVVGGGYEFKADNGFLFRAAPYLFVGKASGAWLGLSLGYSI